jgi:hypothetical protein
MATHHTDDQDIDPIELTDHDDDIQGGQGDDDTPIITEEEPAALDPDAEIVAEIEKVAVPDEEAAAKQKAHMISQDLINKPLTFEDLIDEGSI